MLRFSVEILRFVVKIVKFSLKMRCDYFGIGFVSILRRFGMIISGIWRRKSLHRTVRLKNGNISSTISERKTWGLIIHPNRRWAVDRKMSNILEIIHSLICCRLLIGIPSFQVWICCILEKLKIRHSSGKWQFVVKSWNVWWKWFLIF